ncbi:hypothetical protein CTI12_AA091220 [Artemisia annua]|uniref:Helitron helicase-like domain-containing protein n=1 Tax=Artemisia annua TaxID=35608 RepID=A0A2U1NFH3_ARTAN|nr:hypothetical protein CTI12_AA091220 [Artemisia annua]
MYKQLHHLRRLAFSHCKCLQKRKNGHYYTTSGSMPFGCIISYTIPKLIAFSHRKRLQKRKNGYYYTTSGSMPFGLLIAFSHRKRLQKEETNGLLLLQPQEACLFGLVSRVNGKNQRRISSDYVPKNNKRPRQKSNTVNHVTTINETSQRYSKRPRFTQVREQDLHKENSNMHASSGHRRRIRQARDKMGSAEIPDFKIKLFGVAGAKQYDLPEGDSIGAIVFEGGPNVETNYDVIIEPRGGQPQRIDKLNPHYMSFHFPLLFIHGDEGYHLGLKLLGKGGQSTDQEKQMTMKILMAGTIKDISLAEPDGKEIVPSEDTSTSKRHGKEIVAQTEATNLLILKPADLDKTIHVKVYRKWTTLNKASVPAMHSCILLDQQYLRHFHTDTAAKQILTVVLTTDDKAQPIATAIATPQADLETNIPTAIPKIEPKTTTTPVQEQIDITESSLTKAEKKKTGVRRQLFEATKQDSETSSTKKSKKND